VLDVILFKDGNCAMGQGLYSMYVASKNGILLYEGVDRLDKTAVRINSISNEFPNCTLTMGAIDCNSNGCLLFDL
jgi:hypothetical protein